ncbi:MAG: metal ABC transporter permease [Candidatus Cloacimonetes bacterium]|nr:metal ABC transporter permease [Candidatus Cloacimonadota bacterium]
MELADFFQYRFLLHALIGAILSAAATSQLSVFLTLKKVSFLGEAFSHMAFAGIALALLIGTDLTITAIGFVILIAILIGLFSKYYYYQETNIITIFLSVSMAIGIILISLNKNYTVDLTSYLFGNIILITTRDLCFLAILLGVNAIFIYLFFKELFYMTYNYSVARIYGISVDIAYYLFIILLAVNIVISVKIVGVILITAQLILPGITALNLVRNMKSAIILSVILAEISAIGGIILSYQLNLPSGATIVILSFIIFIGTLIYKEMASKTANS